MASAEQFNLKRFQLLMLLSGGGANDEETENTGETEATSPRITTSSSTTTSPLTQTDTLTGGSPSDETSETPTKTGLNPSLGVEMGRKKSRPLSYIPSSTEVALGLKPSSSSSSSSSSTPPKPATPWETSSKPRTPRDGSLKSVIGTRVIPPEYRTKGKAPPTIRVLTEEDSSFVVVDLSAETTVGEVKVKVAKKFGPSASSSSFSSSSSSSSDELIGLGLGCDAKHFELFIIENERGYRKLDDDERPALLISQSLETADIKFAQMPNPQRLNLRMRLNFLLGWSNYRLNVRAIALHDLIEQTRDGIALAHLVEVCFCPRSEELASHPHHHFRNVHHHQDSILDSIARKQPVKPKDRLKNLQTVFRAFQRCSLSIPPRITPEDIMAGNVSTIVELLWIIFLKVEGVHLLPSPKTSLELSHLQSWVKLRVGHYKGIPEDIFQAFRSGLLVGALVHSTLPTALPFELMLFASQNLNYNKLESLQKGVEAAEKNLRMPKLFTSDAELGDVDDTCIIIYLLILSHIIASFDKQTLMPKRAQTCIPSSSSTSSSSLSTFSSSSSSLASSALTVVLSMTFRSFGEDFPKSKKLTVSRSLTGEEVYRLIAEKMKIPDPGDFSCFEMKSDNDVFDIPRDGKPLSVDKDTKEVKVIVVANKKKKKEK